MSLASTYKNRKVLLTGHTGFKGSWLGWWLTKLGAHVTGLALAPEYPNGPFSLARMDQVMHHIEGDIRDPAVVDRAVRDAEPDLVLHLAAQAIVRESYVEPVQTAATNIMGTVHVMDAVRRAGRPCAMVVITSDKCYENIEASYAYSEDDRMGGHDLYSASKGCAELMVSAYRRSFFQENKQPAVSLASARAGNVIGPGDWAKDRIVPDAMSALFARRPIEVRNPRAVRPWQHVLEPLAGYLSLGARLLESGGEQFADGWNFGPEPDATRTVGDLADLIVETWGDGTWQSNVDPDAAHEAHLLSLNIEKVKFRLGWYPAWGFEASVRHTVAGYRDIYAAGDDPEAVRRILDREIDSYCEDAGISKIG